MKKNFEKESEEDRFNRLSRNLQILLEDQDLNVPKICSTLVEKRRGQKHHPGASRATIDSHHITRLTLTFCPSSLFSSFSITGEAVVHGRDHRATDGERYVCMAVTPFHAPPSPPFLLNPPPPPSLSFPAFPNRRGPGGEGAPEARGSGHPGQGQGCLHPLEGELKQQDAQPAADGEAENKKKKKVKAEDEKDEAPAAPSAPQTMLPSPQKTEAAASGEEGKG